MKTGTLLLVPRDHSVTAKFNCTFVTGVFGIVGECRSGLVTNLADGFHSEEKHLRVLKRYTVIYEFVKIAVQNGFIGQSKSEIAEEIPYIFGFMQGYVDS